MASYFSRTRRHLLPRKLESLEESDNLPDPDVFAQEIVEDLEAALEQFREIAVDIRANSVSEQDPEIIE